MKSIILRYTGMFIICLATYQQSSAKNIDPPVGSGSLSGKITEKNTGAAVSDVSVYIPDLKLGAISDSLGRYQFKSLPPGTFLIEVSHIGFKPLTATVIIKGAVTQDFSVTDEYVEQSPVVVTGLTKATQIKRSPIPVISVSHDYITTNINTNIIDAIAKIPGVSAVTTGPNVSKPYIRGLGYNRILTLYDGVRQEGQQWGDEHGIEVDQYGINKIEVIKGPASLTYGSDALAGVVNLIPTPPAPEGKIVGEILSEYQTNNGLYAFSEMLSGTKNGFEWLGRVSHKQASNYQNKYDGRVYGTAYNETDAHVSLGLHRNWGYSHLSLSLYDNLQKIPDGSRDSATRKFTKQITEADTLRPIVSDDELRSYDIAGTHQHIQHYRIFLNNNFVLGNSRLAVNLGFQKSHRREFAHPEDLYTPGLDLRLDTYTYDVKYYLPEFNGWSISFGTNGMYQNNNVTNGTFFVIPSYRSFDFGPFATIKKSLGKVDLAGGIRYDSRHFSNDQLYSTVDTVTGFNKPYYGPVTSQDTAVFNKYSHTFSGVSGSLGFTYNPTEKLTIKANISRGFRAPNVAEISANGVHPGTNVYQIGNDAFKPEYSLQEDIGFIFASKYAVINFSLFNNTIDNYIFNQRLVTSTGADSIIVAGNQTYKFQQGKANLYGGEINVDLHPTRSFHFENSLSVVYGVNKSVNGKALSDSSKYLPFIPPTHGMSEIRYEFSSSKGSCLVNPYIKAQVVYYAQQNRVYLTDNTETQTPGYTLFNMGLGSGIANKNGKTLFNIYIMGNNLFDVAYQDHLSRLKYFEAYSSSPTGHLGIYNMGRNFAFKIIFPLEFRYN